MNYILHFTIKGREEETEKKQGIPPLIHPLYYRELLKEENTEAGETAEGLRIRRK